MRRGRAFLIALGVLAVVLLAVLVLAGDRVCGTNEDGVQGQYEPPVTCFFPEVAPVG